MNRHVTTNPTPADPGATQPADAASVTDRVEKTLELRAPVSRVWRALTDHKEFGAWFGAEIKTPFVPGQVSRGALTHPCTPHAKFEATIVAMEPERLFSYRWHPNSIDPDVDCSQEEPTLVTFTLESIPGGTRLRVVESGFDKLPATRRAAAFSGNSNGWTKQIENIRHYIDHAVSALLQQQAAQLAPLGETAQPSSLPHHGSHHDNQH